MSAAKYGAFTSTGAILVLFILLVIISRAFGTNIRNETGVQRGADQVSGGSIGTRTCCYKQQVQS